VVVLERARIVLAVVEHRSRGADDSVAVAGGVALDALSVPGRSASSALQGGARPRSDPR
jgi:hypothetical protein